jgi:hypothetical protein
MGVPIKMTYIWQKMGRFANEIANLKKAILIIKISST